MSFHLKLQNLLMKLSEDLLYNRLIIQTCLDWGRDLFCSQLWLVSSVLGAVLPSSYILVAASCFAPLARSSFLLASQIQPSPICDIVWLVFQIILLYN